MTLVTIPGNDEDTKRFKAVGQKRWMFGGLAFATLICGVAAGELLLVNQLLKVLFDYSFRQNRILELGLFICTRDFIGGQRSRYWRVLLFRCLLPIPNSDQLLQWFRLRAKHEDQQSPRLHEATRTVRRDTSTTVFTVLHHHGNEDTREQ